MNKLHNGLEMPRDSGSIGADEIYLTLIAIYMEETNMSQVVSKEVGNTKLVFVVLYLY